MNCALVILSALEGSSHNPGHPSLYLFPTLMSLPRNIFPDHHLTRFLSPYSIHFSSKCLFFIIWDMFIICLPHSMRVSHALLRSRSSSPYPGHRVRPELLFKEIYLTPRGTKTLSSAFRKGHSPNGFSPWSQTVSRREAKKVQVCRWVSTPTVAAGCCSPSTGVLGRRGAWDHTPALIISLWIPGNWDAIIFPFRIDFRQLTLAQKASTLCFITNHRLPNLR